MKKIIFGCIFLVAATSISWGQNSIEPLKVEPTKPESDSTDDPDFEKLMGKWIVRSVVHDGELTPAQIGQKEGDIISMVARDNKTFLS